MNLQGLGVCTHRVTALSYLCTKSYIGFLFCGTIHREQRTCQRTDGGVWQSKPTITVQSDSVASCICSLVDCKFGMKANVRNEGSLPLNCAPICLADQRATAIYLATRSCPGDGILCTCGGRSCYRSRCSRSHWAYIITKLLEGGSRGHDTKV